MQATHNRQVSGRDLRDFAIVIDGPRWCGKTRTSEEHCRSAYHIRGRSQIQAIQVVIASNSTFFLRRILV